MRLHLLTFLVILLCRGSLSATDSTDSTSPSYSATSDSTSVTAESTTHSGFTTTTAANTMTDTATTPIVTAGTDLTTIPITAGTDLTTIPITAGTSLTTIPITAGTGLTTTPNAGTTTQTVPTTVGVTTERWTIPLNDTDPTDLLRKITILNNEVTTLKANLEDLYNGLNINGANNYITQLQNLNNTITELDTNTADLGDQIDGVLAIYSATESNIQPLLDHVQCFRTSQCPSVCPGNLLIANSTLQQFSYTSAGKFNCTTTLQSIDGTSITATGYFSLNGSATLIVKNGMGTVGIYNSTEYNQTLSLEDSYLSFTYYRIDQNDTISLSVTYQTDDTCNGYNCSGHGTCVVHNQQPFCNCRGCYQGDYCDESIDPCQGNQVLRLCKNRGGQCVPDDNSDTCDWKCICPNGKQVDDKTCSNSVSDSMFMEEVKKWLYWKN